MLARFAFRHSAATLNLLRAFTHGGYANLANVRQWTLGFVKDSPQSHHYEELADRISEALGRCRLFLSIGTSGNVYPAAGFVQEARHAGAQTVELNLQPSEGHSLFAQRSYGPATEVVPAFVERLVADA